MTAEAPVVAFARDVAGFPLWPRQAAILSELYAQDVRVAVWRLGRRAGKGRMAALLAVYEGSAGAEAHLAAVPEGERVAIVVVASSQRQARIIHRYARGYLGRPQLRDLLVSETKDELVLRNGIVIMTLPCTAAAVRGEAAAAVILDECAWWYGIDGSLLDPVEIWAAVSPATAQFPAGRLIVSSTPRWSTGWFASMCERAASGRVPGWRHWHEPTSTMNPRISQAFLDGERAADPETFAREYGAELSSAIGSVFDGALVRAAIERRGALPPVAGVRYQVAIDPAYTGDAFALLVAHLEGTMDAGRVVVDRVQTWKGTRGDPVRHDRVLDEVAAIAGAYGQAPVTTDQLAAAIVTQGLRDRGVTVHARPWTNEAKVNGVAAVRRLLYAGRLILPDVPQLVAELSAYEQKATPGGRPRFAAPGSGHDDYVSVLMAAVLELSRSRGVRTLGLHGVVTFEDPDELSARKRAARDPVRGWIS